MSYFVVATVLGGLLASPHVLASSRLDPRVGIALWLSLLGLRAAVAVSLAIAIVLYAPATQLFVISSHWCWHAVIPLVSTHLGIDGHRVGDVTLLAPATLLALSLVSVSTRTWLGARQTAGWLERRSVGIGPQSSIVVSDREIVLAVAGVRAPRVVVSAGALLRLDDGELAAGLAHERAHVRNRHCLVVMFARCLHAIARPIPGSGRALSNLRFQVERHADLLAARETNDPVALASAICKAALAHSAARPPSLTALGEEHVERRLASLLGETQSAPTTLSSIATGLTAAAVAGILVWAAAMPEFASASYHAMAMANLDSIPGCS